MKKLPCKQVSICARLSINSSHSYQINESYKMRAERPLCTTICCLLVCSQALLNKISCHNKERAYRASNSASHRLFCPTAVWTAWIDVTCVVLIRHLVHRDGSFTLRLGLSVVQTGALFACGGLSTDRLTDTRYQRPYYRKYDQYVCSFSFRKS